MLETDKKFYLLNSPFRLGPGDQRARLASFIYNKVTSRQYNFHEEHPVILCSKEFHLGLGSETVLNYHLPSSEVKLGHKSLLASAFCIWTPSCLEDDVDPDYHQRQLWIPGTFGFDFALEEDVPCPRNWPDRINLEFIANAKAPAGMYCTYDPFAEDKKRAKREKELEAEGRTNERKMLQAVDEFISSQKSNGKCKNGTLLTKIRKSKSSR